MERRCHQQRWWSLGLSSFRAEMVGTRPWSVAEVIHVFEMEFGRNKMKHVLKTQSQLQEHKI